MRNYNYYLAKISLYNADGNESGYFNDLKDAVELTHPLVKPADQIPIIGQSS